MSKVPEAGAEGAMATGEMSLRSADSLLEAVGPERGLVDQCRQGDPQAFSRLVALHEAMVFNLAARLLGDAEEARDVAQDVFLQVYRTLGRFQGRSGLKTWIYRIVVNQCHNRRRWWRRRHQKQRRSLDELTPQDEARLSASEAGRSSPYEAVRRSERARQVQSALLALSFDHRVVLLLREVEGLSCDAIGATLGLPEGTVKSRLARGREALRRRLTPDLVAEWEPA